jgi:hypothetical protein
VIENQNDMVIPHIVTHSGIKDGVGHGAGMQMRQEVEGMCDLRFANRTVLVVVLTYSAPP